MASSTNPAGTTPDETSTNKATSDERDASTDVSRDDEAATVPVASASDEAPSTKRGLAALRGSKLVAAAAIGALAAALLFGGGFATGLGARVLLGGDRGHAWVGDAEPGHGADGEMPGRGGPGFGGDRGGAPGR